MTIHPYALRDQFTSRNQTPGTDANAVWGQGARSVQGICIHHWGSKGQTFEGVESYLCVNTKPTSAHFVAQSGLVSCIVSPWNCAYAQGHAWANSHLVSIECRPEMTPGDLQTVAQLVRDLRHQFGDLPLSMHQAWQSTACPGDYVAQMDALDALARTLEPSGILDGAPAPTAPKAPALPKPVEPRPNVGGAYVPDPHWKVEPGETLSMAAKWAGVTVERLAAYNGIKDPNVIKVGERIWPPVGRDTWTVDPGDTLSAIAKFYGASMTVQALQFANGINDVTALPVGLRLQIP